MGLYLGIAVSDDYSQISAYVPETGQAEPVTLQGDGFGERVPTVIGKKKGEDTWVIGEEAYRMALFGTGTVVDRLVNLVHKRGTATIEGVKYNSEFLMSKYIEKLTDLARRQYNDEDVNALVFSVQALESRLNDILMRAAEHTGISREKVQVFCNTECFAYYVISQESDIWTNQVSMFDLRPGGLFYYEMRAVRGRRPVVIEASGEKLPDGFSVEVLETPSGEKIGDTILTSCAKRVLSKKVITSVFLTGKGFEQTDWAHDFLGVVCNKHRVFQCNQLYSQGAAYAAYDTVRETTAYPYLMVCEGRLGVTISTYALYNGKKEQVVLAQAGSNWTGAKASASFILDDTREIELISTHVLDGKTQKYTISLEELPERPKKTTRIELIISFASETQMTVRVVDQGFGELFPSSEKVIKSDISLAGGANG